MKWLDRRMVDCPLHFGLCLSDVDLQRELQRLGVKQEVPFMLADHAHATTHFLVHGATGRHCAIVCMCPPNDRTGVQIAALLVHESVHIWQEARARMGERSPSSEFEAYSIQAIAQELMQAYAEWSER